MFLCDLYDRGNRRHDCEWRVAQMYIKYNAVLRGLQFAFAEPEFASLCRGNKYTTTQHCINSAIIKLSKLTKAAKVYRGVWGCMLPDAWRTPNDYGVRGGIEGGYLSTTTDMGTALFYAKVPTVTRPLRV